MPHHIQTLEKKYPRLKKFPELGRVRGIGARMTEATFSSAAYGNRDSINTTVDGRVQFDLLPYMFRNHKLSSYSLNSVSAEFLGQQKEDVHHSIIADLQNGTDADRHRLAVYCLKDSLLPIRLMDKLAVRKTKHVLVEFRTKYDSDSLQYSTFPVYKFKLTVLLHSFVPLRVFLCDDPLSRRFW